MRTKKYDVKRLSNIKWMALTLLLGAVVFTYFVPRAIMYPDYAPISWLIFIVIFFVIPILLFTVLILFSKRFKMSLVMAISSALVVGPTFGLFQGYRERLELTRDGVWTKAVTAAHKLRHRKVGNKKWTVKYKYTVDGVTYETAYHDEKQKGFTETDTVNIIYSKQFPKIYKIGDDWQGSQP